jgi:ParB family chromosome partitioning protein
VESVPVVIRTVTEQQHMEIALIENLQREDLNPIEEAKGYRSLSELYHMTQEQIAESVGKSRPAIANALRLLELPDEVKQLLSRNILSAGHAKVLLSVDGERDRTLLARECAERSLTVRELEKRVARMRKPVAEQKKGTPDLPESYVRSLVEVLHRHLGCAVRLTSGVTHANGKHTKGVLEIDFFDNDELDRVIAMLGLKVD